MITSDLIGKSDPSDSNAEGGFSLITLVACIYFFSLSLVSFSPSGPVNRKQGHFIAWVVFYVLRMERRDGDLHAESSLNSLENG